MEFDCIIIGGGPAGLYASIYLARFCRSVLIIDNEQSRAGLIPLSHNYPGYPDGIKGTEILELLKKQVAHYDVQTKVDTVTTVKRSEPQFIVSTASQDYLARSILLATGIKDDCPSHCKGEKNILCGALRHCLICDGFEVKGMKVAVFGFNSHAYDVAQGLLTYTDDIHIVSCEEKPNFIEVERQFLLDNGIKIHDKPIDSISFTDKNETLIRWKDGEELLVGVSYLGMGMKLKLPQMIGFEIEVNGSDRIKVDGDQMTTVAGIFAAGDVCNSLGQISTAFGYAAVAARGIHQYLKKITGTF